jgi:hypothetical protein
MPANKLPQAYHLFVLEQKLRHWLLIRSCYYTGYISNMPSLNKVFHRNLNELACCSLVISLLPVELFGLLQVLGSYKIEQMNRLAYHLFF